MVIFAAFFLVVKVVAKPLLRLVRRKPLKPPPGSPKPTKTKKTKTKQKTMFSSSPERSIGASQTAIKCQDFP